MHVSSDEGIFATMEHKTKVAMRERPRHKPRIISTNPPIATFETDPPVPLCFGTILGASFLVIGEIFVHGVLTAFVGAYLGSLLASTFCPGLGSFAEILLTCGIIAALMRLGIYGASFESPYFKRYFILDHGYECVIAIRESFNILFLIISMWFLLQCMKDTGKNGGIKEAFLGEGLPDIALKFMCSFLSVFHKVPAKLIEEVVPQKDPSWFAWMKWWSVPDEEISQEVEGKELKIHSASFMFAVALVIAAIGKMLYLTVLSTYMKSVNILMKLHMRNGALSEDDHDMTATTDAETTDVTDGEQRHKPAKPLVIKEFHDEEKEIPAKKSPHATSPQAASPQAASPQAASPQATSPVRRKIVVEVTRKGKRVVKKSK